MAVAGTEGGRTINLKKIFLLGKKNMNLWRDINLQCLRHLRKIGWKEYDPCGRQIDEFLVYLFNYYSRYLSECPRKVFFSREFQRPKDKNLDSGLEAILKTVRDGGSLSRFLSRQTLIDNCFSHYDAMLNEWNIYHFHLSDEIAKNSLVKRTRELLFAFVTDDSFYCIQIGDHDSFTDTALLDIIHNNWPSLLEPFTIRSDAKLGSVLTKDERKTLRKKRMNALTTLSDGTTIGLLNFGSMMNGSQVQCYCDAIYIRRILKLIEQNISSLEFHDFLFSSPLAAQLCRYTPVWRLVKIHSLSFLEIEDVSNGYKILVKRFENQCWYFIFPFATTHFYDPSKLPNRISLFPIQLNFTNQD